MKVRIIRTSGAEENHTVTQRSRSGPGEMAQIARLIGAHTVDVVNLRDGRVMIVDDDGWETRETSEVRADGALHVAVAPVRPRKPINDRATVFYRAVCKPGTTHQIAGDVAIVNDADFA